MSLPMSLVVHTVESAPFAENSYIAHYRGAAEAVVIDPGFEPEPIIAYLSKQGLKLAAILNTHGHVDHIAGNAAIKEAFPDAPLVIGVGDAAMLTDPWLNLSGPFGMSITSPPADRTLREGETYEAAGLKLEVLEIPGHSPGHIVFVWRDEPPIVFGGDVLFAGSIGRTDFPGGDLNLLLAGIRAKLWPLPETTIVYPGHGPATTIGEERRSNPFLTAG
jgi:glyoxylase-like metal-dependent hydrolase (beta-lactamase superfamily II)